MMDAVAFDSPPEARLEVGGQHLTIADTAMLPWATSDRGLGDRA